MFVNDNELMAHREERLIQLVERFERACKRMKLKMTASHFLLEVCECGKHQVLLTINNHKEMSKVLG